MIKINMLRSLGLQQAGVGLGLGGGTADVMTDEMKKQAGIKLLVILLFPAMLYMYERFNLSVIGSELQNLQQEVSVIEAKKASFGSAAPRVEKYTKEKKEIDKQLEIVRSLTRHRLREVKALDALQSLIPPRTWFKEIQLESGKVRLEGYTLTEDGVSELMRALDNSVYFSKVLPKSTVQVDLPTGPAKKFELEFMVGKQE